MNRAILPIPDIDRPHRVAYDAKDPGLAFPPISQVLPPSGAPNVLIVLIDDVGFGASSVFGGPCQTPNAERLARQGLKYTRFHTTALCSPSRAALLSGRNHHTVNMGAITEMATSAPGQTSARPNTCAALAETLKLNGYSTAQFGKCHEVPVWETSPLGPFDHWPSPGGGFEYFYGFIAGETDQYSPELYEGTTPVEPSKTPEEGYTLNEDLADHAIAYVRRQKTLMPDRPFFMYYAPGATHAPHHVPQEWIEKYRGKFDQGWDTLREETFARQKALGVIPQDAELTDRSEGLPAWEDTDPAMRPTLARQMEVYAAFLEQTDHHVGRLLAAIDDLGATDDTLIFYIIGDNGGSAEGTLQGTLNEMISLNGFPSLETPEFLQAHIDELGAPGHHNHYAVPWGHAMNTPYQWTKQIASHFGGTRNGTVVHWPRGIESKGEVRHQFHHIIDVAATILEAAHIPEPTFVNGVQQKPYEGVSMVYSFNDTDAADRHTTQYFEMMGNRGIYHEGWTAVTRHRTPWDLGGANLPAFDDDVWELYDTTVDWTQSRNVAADYPEKLASLQRQWLIEAVKYNVLPLDDRAAERANPDLAGRPTLARGTSQLFYGGTTRISEHSVISTKNRSFSLTANISVADSRPAQGVIASLGGRAGGFVLYALDGNLAFTYNFFNLDITDVTSSSRLSPGNHQVRMEFAYDGTNVMTDLAMGGNVTLYVDGASVAEGRVERTVPGSFSGTFDVGVDSGSTVSDRYPERGNQFNGSVDWVQIDTGAIDPNLHTLEAHLRLQVAAGIQ